MYRVSSTFMYHGTRYPVYTVRYGTRRYSTVHKTVGTRDWFSSYSTRVQYIVYCTGIPVLMY